MHVRPPSRLSSLSSHFEFLLVLILNVDNAHMNVFVSFPEACLLGAIQAVAGRMGKKDMAKDAVVHTSVHIGEPSELSGFGIAVDIKVEGVDEELLQAGHDVCLPSH
jgi:organic hydroperoxide reductase OsmC/OhrA